MYTVDETSCEVEDVALHFVRLSLNLQIIKVQLVRVQGEGSSMWLHLGSVEERTLRINLAVEMTEVGSEVMPAVECQSHFR